MNNFSIPESLSINISFDYKITFVNSITHTRTNLKGYFVFKNRFSSLDLKISDIQRNGKSESDLDNELN